MENKNGKKCAVPQKSCISRGGYLDITHCGRTHLSCTYSDPGKVTCTWHWVLDHVVSVTTSTENKETGHTSLDKMRQVAASVTSFTERSIVLTEVYCITAVKNVWRHTENSSVRFFCTGSLGQGMILSHFRRLYDKFTTKIRTLDIWSKQSRNLLT